ncbi:hypothetical protein C7450_10833 [Chelatococcus asaccharovorans]|uniref:Uncharacterized protein n=1 Tax=Chelatococcus asaccharovorans TaxID=28210 RepID=A0A2V3U2S1_9HYPH|nr:hypothetical protein C7450_10833 [Chelatococcus asaccharovorans]
MPLKNKRAGVGNLKQWLVFFSRKIRWPLYLGNRKTRAHLSQVIGEPPLEEFLLVIKAMYCFDSASSLFALLGY